MSPKFVNKNLLRDGKISVVLRRYISVLKNYAHQIV